MNRQVKGFLPGGTEVFLLVSQEDTAFEIRPCQCESSGPAPLPKGKLPPANIVFASVGPRWHNDKNISPVHASTALPILRRPSLRSLSFLLFNFLVFSLPNKFFLIKKSLPLGRPYPVSSDSRHAGLSALQIA